MFLRYPRIKVTNYNGNISYSLKFDIINNTANKLPNIIPKVQKIDNKRDIEYLISILNLGLCVAIENGVLNIEEAEAYLYSPYTMEQLEKLDVATVLIDIIHLGTELEDARKFTT